MEPGDLFYIADPQTNTVLERSCLANENGMIRYNFRDSISQSCPEEMIFVYHHRTAEEAIAAVKHSHEMKAQECRVKAKKLLDKAARLESEIPVVTDVVIDKYSDLERIGKCKK
jgi:hypothetical protein